ncbi:MAG: ankyrin repeat domain-containing protein [Luteolibacter sp.]
MRSIVLASLLSLAAATAQTPAPPLNELLRDGLYAEEVSRDHEAAARNYDQILARATAEEPFVTNALFRLAEIRRKQNRKEEAATLYQRLLTRYPDADPQAKLSRDALAALGAAPAPDNAPVTADEETQEIQRLTGLAKDSPDLLKPLDELPKAAANGWLRAIQYLLDRLTGTERQDGLNVALNAAAGSGRLAVCQALLEKGADPNGVDGGRILNTAVWRNRREVVALLLSKGANPNAAPPYCDSPTIREINNKEEQDIGAALHIAAFTNNLPLAEMLLKSGADPALPAPRSLNTPLHLVFRGEPPKSAIPSWIKLLLTSGAKADATIRYPASNGQPERVITPLSLAAGNSDLEACRLLIEAGAKPTGATELARALNHSNLELTKLLLAHGADPKAPVPERKSLLEIAADSKNAELFRLVWESGAPVDSKWQDSAFPNASEEIRLELFKKTFFPEWSKEGNIRTVMSSKERVSFRANTFQAPLLADHAKDATPPQLAEALLGVLPDASTDVITALTVYRRNPSGDYDAMKVALLDQAPYPKLQWGDILWFQYDQFSRVDETWTGWAPGIRSSLLQHVSVPISVEWADRKESVTLRGDCLSYDPTKPVMPYLKAGPLVSLLTGRPFSTFSVVRKGWTQPIRLEAAKQDAKRFNLKEGDTLVIDPIPTNDPDRNQSILVTSPGLWFNRKFRADELAAPPTLLQAIAALYDFDLPQESFAYPQDLDVSLRNDWPQGLGVLPHPDLAHIRIHRLKEDGETTLEVDLEKAAAACTEQTTAEAARKADLDLQRGDIVEIPIKTTPNLRPWEGFTEAQGRLLSKALSCQVEVSDSPNLALKQIAYVPPRIVQTPAGALPFADTAGMSLPHAMQLPNRSSSVPANDRLQLRRGDVDSEKIREGTFLRDGDRIGFNSTALGNPGVPSPPTPVPSPGTNRAPRPRIIPGGSR